MTIYGGACVGSVVACVGDVLGDVVGVWLSCVPDSSVGSVVAPVGLGSVSPQPQSSKHSNTANVISFFMAFYLPFLLFIVVPAYILSHSQVFLQSIYSF